jgi:homoserine kinase
LKIKEEFSSCTAVAPSSTANLGPGYDVFGLGLNALEDTITITKGSERSKRLTISLRDQPDSLIPSEPEANSAGLVIKRMSEDFGINYDLNVTLVKRIPAGFGIGSSAASAAAAAVAFDGLFDLKLQKSKIVEYAAEGEIASAGTKHYDNVAAAILGGFVIVRINPVLEFIKINPPQDLVLVVAMPEIKVSNKKTKVARSVLPEQVLLKSVIHNVSNASTIVAGFIFKDSQMIAKGIDDAIVEPARKHLVPGYDEVKKNALKAGALAITISGAGPSMISFLQTDQNAMQVADSMAAGFKAVKVMSRTFVCHASYGAKVISVK